MDNNQSGSGSSSKILTPEPSNQTSEDKTSVTSDQLNRALKDLNEDFSKKIGELEEKLKPVEEKVGDVNNQLRSYLDKVDEVKDKVIQTLAVFVGLFTFVSITFSFLANKDLKIEDFIGLTLLLGGILIIFILLIRILVTKESSDEKLQEKFMYIALGLIILGIIIVGVVKWYRDLNISSRRMDAVMNFGENISTSSGIIKAR